MYYDLTFNSEKLDEVIDTKEYPIFAEVSNLEEIEYPGIKKGWFNCIFYRVKEKIKEWPEVYYYYSSKVSKLENEYLSNIDDWPIIHKKVQEEFEKQGIKGIQYLPVQVIDVVTHEISDNYVVMNIMNWVDGIDLEASSYDYEEEDDAYFFDFQGIVLDEKKCERYDIFRCEKEKVSIYVSEKIKKIFEEKGWDWFSLSEMPTSHKKV